MADTTINNTNEETVEITLPTKEPEQITEENLYVKILRDFSDTEHDVLMSRINADTTKSILYPITRVENVVNDGGKTLTKILEELEQKETGIDAIIDKIYPIGCFFETTNTEFNPNTEWGGTWEKDNDGAVLISQDSINNSVNTIIGSNNISLSDSNMPNHRHSYIQTDSVAGHTLTLSEIPSHSHAIHADATYVTVGGDTQCALIKSGAGGGVNTRASGDSGAHTHELNTSTGYTDYQGSGNSFSVIQKSKIIVRWHRTA